MHLNGSLPVSQFHQGSGQRGLVGKRRRVLAARAQLRPVPVGLDGPEDVVAQRRQRDLDITSGTGQRDRVQRRDDPGDGLVGAARSWPAAVRSWPRLALLRCRGAEPGWHLDRAQPQPGIDGDHV